MALPKKKGGRSRPSRPSNWGSSVSAGGGERLAARPAVDVDAGEQKQPHHVDEVPVPGREFEAEMLVRPEVAGVGAEQAHGQEDGSDDDVEAVEAGRHEEGGAVDVAFEREVRVAVLVGLHAGEQRA